MSFDKHFETLGIVLPEPATPVANYVAFKKFGNLISISGQLPMGQHGLEYVGKVGTDIDVGQAKKAARLSGLNIIAQIRNALENDLSKLASIVRLGGFVNCIDGFADQPQIINAASDLMVEAFGEIGRHSRSAVGVNALPLNASVEIEALIETR